MEDDTARRGKRNKANRAVNTSFSAGEHSMMRVVV